MDDRKADAALFSSQTSAARGLFSRPYMLALVLAAVGSTLTIGGAKLLLLGGSPYYAAAGLATLTSGVLVAMGRRAGARLFGAMLLVTVVWAIAEVGFDGWSLLARLAAPCVLGLWFLLPWTARRLKPPSARGVGPRLAWASGAVAAALLLGATGHALLVPERPDPMFQAGVQPHLPQATATAVADMASGDWPVWGGDAAGTRFSALAQITPANVDRLELAWTYHFGPAPPRPARRAGLA